MTFRATPLLYALLLSTIGLPGGDAAALTSQSVETRITRSIRSEIGKRALHEELAPDSTFVVLFSYQDKRNLARQSHTFASFVKLNHDLQKWTTFSWLPADFDRTQRIDVFANFATAALYDIVNKHGEPVPGKNFSLKETLAWALRPGLRLGIWGPYSITQDLYNMALERKAELDEGRILYLPDDRHLRKSRVAVNCIHAITDMGGHYATRGYFGDHFSYDHWGFKGTKETLQFLASSKGLHAIKENVNPEVFRVIHGN
jgi:hypothetical protein